MCRKEKGECLIMKRISVRTLVSLAIVTLTLFSFTALNSAAESPSTWTFMVYLDADNNLDYFSLLDMEEMKAAIPSDQVNIVVLLDRLELPAYAYHIINGEEVLLDDFPLNDIEVNMGDPETLQTFITYSINEFPADRYILVLWDHGSSFRGVCWDENTGVAGEVDHLWPWETAAALSEVSLDILAFDACLQATIENLYEYAVAGNDISYIIASEGLVPGEGMPYTAILNTLVADTNTPTLDFAKSWADAFVEFYTTPEYTPGMQISTTLSVIEFAQVNAIVEGLDTLASALEAALADNWETTHELISEARGGTFPLGVSYIDLVSFVDNLSPDFPEAAALSEVMHSAVYVANTRPMEDITRGVGIFFPSSYHAVLWSGSWGRYYFDTAFSETEWPTFMYTYYGDHHGGSRHLHR